MCLFLVFWTRILYWSRSQQEDGLVRLKEKRRSYERDIHLFLFIVDSNIAESFFLVSSPSLPNLLNPLHLLMSSCQSNKLAPCLENLHSSQAIFFFFLLPPDFSLNHNSLPWSFTMSNAFFVTILFTVQSILHTTSM